VAVHKVVVPVSRLKSATRDISFLTPGVDDTWASCPTLCRGIWVRSKKAGFRCCS